MPLTGVSVSIHMGTRVNDMSTHVKDLGTYAKYMLTHAYRVSRNV
jgi:hypothetical protein